MLQDRLWLSKWCLSRRKRWIDVTIATMALIGLSPVFVIIAAAIMMDSGLPIIFRQRRVGRLQNEFQLFKFRTMTTTGSECATGLTQGGDIRVTAVGGILRKWKLDELPQLVNVLRGEMTIVGPRPDMMKFWMLATEVEREILFLTPGLTGAASIAFFDEEHLLTHVDRENLTDFYVKSILPAKAQLDREYAKRATFLSDCGIVLKTLYAPVLRSRTRKSQAYAPFSEQ